jgi:hypothetical protein
MGSCRTATEERLDRQSYRGQAAETYEFELLIRVH